MITPEEMSKIRIITPRSYGYDVINKLYELRLFHVNNYKKGELDNLDNGVPLLQAEELSKTLLTLRAVKARLNVEQTIPTKLKEYSVKEFTGVKQRIERLHAETAEAITAISSSEEELKRLKNRHTIVQALDSLGIDVASLPKLKKVSCFIGIINEKSDVQEKLGKLIHAYELKTANADGEQLAILIVQKDDELKARGALDECGFKPISDFGETRLPQLKKAIERAKKSLEAANALLKKIRVNNRIFLAEQGFILEEEIKKAELPLQCATTAQSLIAEGYVPAKQLTEMKIALHKVTKDHIHIEEEKPGHHDDVPVKLNNPRAVKNFEVLTRLYELPQQIEIDPTWLMFITFPLFFAFMLGDVGYGATLLILFLYLKKKFPEGKQFINVLIYAALVTLVFGVAFGEYFGFEHVSLETGEQLCDAGICFQKEILKVHGNSEIVYSFPRLLNRGHSHVNIVGYDILTVLFIGALIGAVHLNFGFLIGFYNVWRAHGLKSAVLEKLSWLIMEAGLVLLVLSLTNMIVIPAWTGGVVFALSLVMLYLGEGVKGLIEVPALFSNILSYMRLGAVGLASVGLAAVINENLAKPFLEKGGIFVIVALIIMIVGHIINIGLGVLGPFLHGIRLHYVEFFSKFFHGGGQEYTPFGTKAQMGGE
ncbi:V-type ATP synthase subunit I [Candidatus Woesearchaeota archaeon]|nr:V-type ATP synthase subunit I [Candidatus Woesearchaeota archaeon]